MSHREEDPRSKRSKKMFQEAAIRLIIRDNDTSKLTIQKIAKEAQLNRATFYLHYVDINDLLRKIVISIYEELSQIVNDHEDKEEQLMMFLDYLYNNRKLISLFFDRPKLWRKMHAILKEVLEVPKDKEEILTSDTIAASTMGIIMWWLKEGVHFSSEYIAEQILAMHK